MNFIQKVLIGILLITWDAISQQRTQFVPIQFIGNGNIQTQLPAGGKNGSESYWNKYNRVGAILSASSVVLFTSSGIFHHKLVDCEDKARKDTTLSFAGIGGAIVYGIPFLACLIAGSATGITSLFFWSKSIDKPKPMCIIPSIEGYNQDIFKFALNINVKLYNFH